jgi:predicted metal-binding protein
MLTRVEDGPAVVACSTCGGRDAGGMRDGAKLARLLGDEQRRDPAFAGVTVQVMACLFACVDACTVHVRGPGRIGYVLGRFVPDAEAARAILGYAAAHAQSIDGEVPFAAWPEGVKGHFITRTPPPGFVIE